MSKPNSSGGTFFIFSISSPALIFQNMDFSEIEYILNLYVILCFLQIFFRKNFRQTSESRTKFLNFSASKVGKPFPLPHL